MNKNILGFVIYPELNGNSDIDGWIQTFPNGRMKHSGTTHIEELQTILQSPIVSKAYPEFVKKHYLEENKETLGIAMATECRFIVFLDSSRNKEGAMMFVPNHVSEKQYASLEQSRKKLEAYKNISFGEFEKLEETYQPILEINDVDLFYQDIKEKNSRRRK